jgi:hypothetical protein
MIPVLSLVAAMGMAPPLVISSARIELGNGQVIPNGSVLVVDGRIRAVGAEIAVPLGATTFDAKGMTVYPGFIDCYSTAGLKLPTPRASGTELPDTRNTAPATMWKENRRGIRSDVVATKVLDLKGPFSSQYKDGITAVLVSSGDGTLSGVAGVVSLGAEPKVLAPATACEINFRSRGGFGRGDGHDHSDGDEGMAAQRGQQSTQAAPSYPYPGTQLGVLALMRQTLWDAKHYAEQGMAKQDPTYEGLVPLVTGKMPALFTMSTSRDVTRAALYADEFGFKFIINGGLDLSQQIDLLKKYQAPVILSLDLPTEPSRTVAADSTTPKEVAEDRWQAWQERMKGANRINSAGIPFAFRGSLGMSGYLAGVRKLVSSGLPREAALQGMTMNAAKILGLEGELGTIAEGKIANLVIMDGDFANEKSKVVRVIVEGSLFDPEAKPEAEKKEGAR